MLVKSEQIAQLRPIQLTNNIVITLQILIKTLENKYHELI